jgi:hypothetical protein
MVKDDFPEPLTPVTTIKLVMWENDINILSGYEHSRTFDLYIQILFCHNRCNLQYAALTQKWNLV